MSKIYEETVRGPLVMPLVIKMEWNTSWFRGDHYTDGKPIKQPVEEVECRHWS